MTSDARWQKNLPRDTYKVLRQKATEPPFSGSLLNNTAKGMYVCKGCGAELFNSNSKYDSRTPGLVGWPSFSEAKSNNAVKYIEDKSIGMSRTEVVCAKCGGHLGHVFNAADSPSGRHYCINSIALDFKKDKK